MGFVFVPADIGQDMCIIAAPGWMVSDHGKLLDQPVIVAIGLFLNRQLIPVMRRAGAGCILFNSSVLGIVGMKYRGPYVATKFALEGYADVLRMEMAETGIQVVLIEPGPIETDFRKNAIKQFEKWVDWQKSPRRAQYEATLLDLLKKGGSSGVQWPASAVTDAVVKALTARRPKARYRVTTPTHLMAVGRRLLPTRALDWVLSKG